MKKEEKKLFFQLCNFIETDFDESLLKYATPNVLGQLFFNRMQGVAYGVLKQHNLLGKVNREFRNSLNASYEQNIEKNQSFFECIRYIKCILSSFNGKYAMLKGGFLCSYYPIGYRTSNDIDLLVLPGDVSGVGELLLNAGFCQGSIRNAELVPATRREIIESKMTRGETVPYIKKINLRGMKYLEIDINFSLDYKNGSDETLNSILSDSIERESSGVLVPTLSATDFFIHLCSHLYKEATTLPWIEMHRDMTLYKYCDIYVLLSKMGEQEIISIFDRAKQLRMEKICAFAVLQTAELFNISNSFAVSMSANVLRYSPDFIHTVISPVDSKIYVYENRDIVERFFEEDRRLGFKEVKNNV